MHLHSTSRGFVTAVAAAVFASLVGSALSSVPARAQGGTIPPATVTLSPGAATSGSAAPAGGAITRFIRVTGYGEVRVKPDEAHIVFLVSTTAPSALGALQANADQVTRVVKGLHDGGVPQDNILSSESTLAAAAPPPAPSSSTSGASGPAVSGGSDDGTPVDTDIPHDTVQPGPPASTAPQTRFTANARVQVVTYDVSSASIIVQIGMAAGASGVLGMTFEPRNMADLKQRALVEAMKDAANKAGILALGIKAVILYVISMAELPAAAPDSPGGSIAPPVEVVVPVNIEITYAIG